MIFETYTSQSHISPYIESIFHYKDFMPDHSIERVVPTGHIFILFELDGFVRHTFDNETMKPNGTFSKVWVSGMHRNYLSISAHEKSEMFVIQFKPYGAYPFFHFPIDTLNEKVINTHHIFDDSLTILQELLLATEGSNNKFALAEKWLQDRFRESRVPPQQLLAFIDNLYNKPNTSLKQLIESYPNSQKNLIDHFKKYVGLTPKYFQRILRFNEILKRIQNKEQIAWTEVAYACGYSDHSHFIKEFKHFSGFNPSEFIKREFNKDQANFFPLDKDS